MSLLKVLLIWILVVSPLNQFWVESDDSNLASSSRSLASRLVSLRSVHGSSWGPYWYEVIIITTTKSATIPAPTIDQSMDLETEDSNHHSVAYNATIASSRIIRFGRIAGGINIENKDENANDAMH